jgi:hypothetical protein
MALETRFMINQLGGHVLLFGRGAHARVYAHHASETERCILQCHFGAAWWRRRN